jgi:hypothetical protein
MGLLAHHLDGAKDDAVDGGGRKTNATQRFVEHRHRQIIGSDGAEDAPSRVGPSERRSHVTGQDRFSQLMHDGRCV